MDFNTILTPPRRWLIAVLVLAVCTVVYVHWESAGFEPRSARFDAEILWPTYLSGTEPTPLVGIVESKKSTISRSEIVAYAIPGLLQRHEVSDAFDERDSVEVARTTINERGFFELTLPPFPDWEDSSVPLVVFIEVDGQQRGFWRSLSLSGSSESDSRVALQTDRPLYQPGQTILMRSLIMNRREYSPRQDETVRWQIRDPRGNSVFDETDVTDSAGVSSTEFELADQAMQGEYEISLISNWQRTTETVSVRPYHLPRFGVIFVGPTTFAANQDVEIKIESRYLYDEPVTNSDISIALSWENWEGQQTDNLTGKTDDDGHFETRWQLPEGLRERAGVTAVAAVTTETGRTEETTQFFPIVGGGPTVEIFPIGRANFVMGQENEAVALVVDGEQRPVSDQDFTVLLIEKDGERPLDLTSDENGRATFDWTPGVADEEIERLRLKVEMENGDQTTTQRAEVVLQKAPHYLRATASTSRSGESYELVIEPHNEPLLLMVHSRQMVTKSYQLDPRSESYTHEILFDDDDRGLTHLRIFDGREVVDHLPIWVRQKGGESIEVEPEELLYAPGDTGWLNLSFPPVDEAKSEEITFGVVAVDEALYALKERADIPFDVMMRQIPSVMGPLLANTREEDTLDALGRQIQASRFLRAALDAKIHYFQFYDWGRYPYFPPHKSELENKTNVATLVVLIILFLAFLLMSFRKVSLQGVLLSLGYLVLAFTTMLWLEHHFTRVASRFYILFMALFLFLPLIAFLIQIARWVIALMSSGKRFAGLSLAVTTVACISIGLIYLYIEGQTLHSFSHPGDGVSSDGPAPAVFADEERVIESPRSYFPETMLWRPSVAAASSGSARISFPIPDTITTWRVTAWAHSDDGRFGQGEAQIAVVRPVFIDLELPTHMTDGDVLRIPASIVNTTQESLSVQLDVEATEALRIIDSSTPGAFGHAPVYFDHRDHLPRLLPIAPNERRDLLLLVEADGVGAGKLTVNLRAGGTLIDSVERGITVAPLGRITHQTRSGTLGNGLDHHFTFPFNAIAGTSAVDLRFFPGSTIEAAEALSSNLFKPLDSLEQILSTNLASSILLDVLADRSPDAWPGGRSAWRSAHRRATLQISTTYQLMLRLQHYEGGFSPYRGSSAEAIPTAYGIIHLVEMSHIHESEEVIFRALRWLAGAQNDQGYWTGEDLDASIRTTALVVLASFKAPMMLDRQASPDLESALDFLEENLSAITPDHTLALVANAFAETERDQTLTNLLDRLTDQATGGESTYHWMSSSDLFSQIETTAMAATALLMKDVHPEISQGALEFLAQNRSPQGGWGAPQATLWSVMALRNQKSIDGKATIDILLDDDPMPLATEQPRAADHERPGRLTINEDSVVASHFRSAVSTSGDMHLSITPSSPINLAYRATAEYALPWDSQSDEDSQAYSLSLIMADRQIAARSLHSVVALIRNQSDASQQALIVELPIPPAAFVPRDQFESMVDQGIIEQFEILPTHIRLYHRGLASEEELELEYQFAPLIRGRMNLPPLRVYRPRIPQPIFETDGGRLVVD